MPRMFTDLLGGSEIANTNGHHLANADESLDVNVSITLCTKMEMTIVASVDILVHVYPVESMVVARCYAVNAKCIDGATRMAVMAMAIALLKTIR